MSGNTFMRALKDVPVVAVTGESKVVFVSPDTICQHILDTLHENHIRSVPIVDAGNHAVGFVDMIDILEYIISAMKNTKKDVDIADFVKEVLNTPASKLVDFSRRNNFEFVSGAEDLAAIAKMLSSGVLHRVCTGRKFGDESLRNVPLSVCTQSDIIRFLHQEMIDENRGGKDKKPSDMKELNILSALGGIEKRNLILVNAKATLLEVCALMIDESLSAVGIIDDDSGRLIGAFSAADFKRWGKDDFEFFTKPVLEYLKHKNSPNMTPLTILPSNTFGSVIHMMCTSKSHAAWLVNEKYQPEAVLTQTDILRIIISYEDKRI
jgi:CBS domain-containing protein